MLPSREDRIAVRDRQLADQKKRNAQAFTDAGFQEDPGMEDLRKRAKAQRKQATAAAAQPTQRPGSRRTVSFPSKKAEK